MKISTPLESPCPACGAPLLRQGQSPVGKCPECGEIAPMRPRRADADAYEETEIVDWARPTFKVLLVLSLLGFPIAFLEALGGGPLEIAALSFAALAGSTFVLLVFRIADALDEIARSSADWKSAEVSGDRARHSGLWTKISGKLGERAE